MKYILMMLPIGAIWLLSANEQGLVGSWAIWTSLAILVGIGVCQYIAGRRYSYKKCPVREETRNGTKTNEKLFNIYYSGMK